MLCHPVVTCHSRFKALNRDPAWDPSLLPEIAPHAGHRSGLSVIIDMRPSGADVEASISNDFRGAEVNVGTKHTFPRHASAFCPGLPLYLYENQNLTFRLATNNFLVSPGRVTMVEITGERTVATEGYRSLDVDDRKCYFEGELQLQLFAKYSMDNCWIECLLNLTRKVCLFGGGGGKKGKGEKTTK